MADLHAALFGHPVHHSRSPELFAALAAAGGPDIRFTLHDVPPGALGRALGSLRSGRWGAAGVTVPHKRPVAAACDTLLPSARAAGAVNAIARRPDGALVGANTDGEGFLRAVDAGFPGLAARGVSVAVLGAGGAARGVVAALAGRGARVTVVSRAPSRRRDLGAHDVIGWADRGLAPRVRAADLVVQATPLGMHPDVHGMVPLPFDALRPGQAVVDLVYTPWETAFLRLARAAGCVAMNGWPMLVHQAAVAVDLWLGPGAGARLPTAARAVETRDPFGAPDVRMAYAGAVGVR